MKAIYEKIETNLQIQLRSSRHVSPHLHHSIECIYVTEGSLELGIGQELYHMNTNDFAIVFPELIHHYQVFSPTPSRAIYMLVSPDFAPSYLSLLGQKCPAYPIIPSDSLHPDIPHAMETLLHLKDVPDLSVLQQAYTQILLARSLPCFKLVEKECIGSDDIVYRTVAYIASHFMENISLTDMAHDLGYSPYALSRVFSGIFHTNFNQYLNDRRLDYAIHLLQNTDESITSICMNSGFNSLRTFHRAFRNRYHISPGEYRKH